MPTPPSACLHGTKFTNERMGKQTFTVFDWGRNDNGVFKYEHSRQAKYLITDGFKAFFHVPKRKKRSSNLVIESHWYITTSNYDVTTKKWKFKIRWGFYETGDIFENDDDVGAKSIKNAYLTYLSAVGRSTTKPQADMYWGIVGTNNSDSINDVQARLVAKKTAFGSVTTTIVPTVLSSSSSDSEQEQEQESDDEGASIGNGVSQSRQKKLSRLKKEIFIRCEELELTDQERLDLLAACVDQAVVEGVQPPADVIFKKVLGNIFKTVGKGTQTEDQRQLQGTLLTILSDPNVEGTDFDFLFELTGIRRNEHNKGKFQNAKERATRNIGKKEKEKEYFTKRKEVRKYPVAFQQVCHDTWLSDDATTQVESKTGDTESTPIYSLDITPTEVHQLVIKNLRVHYPGNALLADGKGPSLWWVKKYRPDGIIIGDRLSCLCVYHLQWYHFAAALLKFLRAQHKTTGATYGGAVVQQPNCTCGCAIPTNEHTLKWSLVCHPCTINGKKYVAAGCRNGTCQTCPGVPKCPALEDSNEKIKYMKLETHVDSQSDGTSRSRKDFEQQNVSIIDFMKEFTSFIKSDNFHPHHFRAKMQNNAWLAAQKLRDKEAVASIDFAMSHQVKGKRDTSQKFFQAVTTTVFPCVIRVKWSDLKLSKFHNFVQEKQDAKKFIEDNDNLDPHVRITLMFMSEDKNHDKGFVAHVIDEISAWLEEYTRCDALKLFSDGCRAQFKNRHTFGHAGTVLENHGNLKTFEWHFFCSCHGKCLCDPEGGIVKTSCDAFTLASSSNNLPTSKAVYEYAKAKLSKPQYRYKAKEGKRRIGIWIRIFKFIPRPGVTGSVRRSRYSGYTPIVGSNSIHRWIYNKGSVRHSKLSCSCTHCRDYNFSNCINQGHTGELKQHVFSKETESAKWTFSKGQDLGSNLRVGDSVAYIDTSSVRGYTVGFVKLISYNTKRVGAVFQVQQMRPLIGHNCEKQWIAGINTEFKIVPTKRILLTSFSTRRSTRVVSQNDLQDGEDGTIYTLNDRRKEVATILKRLDTLIPDSDGAQGRNAVAIEAAGVIAAAAIAAAAAAEVVADVAEVVAVVPPSEEEQEQGEDTVMGDVLPPINGAVVLPQPNVMVPHPPRGREERSGSPNKRSRKKTRT